MLEPTVIVALVGLLGALLVPVIRAIVKRLETPKPVVVPEEIEVSGSSVEDRVVELLRQAQRELGTHTAEVFSLDPHLPLHRLNDLSNIASVKREYYIVSDIPGVKLGGMEYPLVAGQEFYVLIAEHTHFEWTKELANAWSHHVWPDNLKVSLIVRLMDVSGKLAGWACADILKPKEGQEERVLTDEDWAIMLGLGQGLEHILNE